MFKKVNFFKFSKFLNDTIKKKCIDISLKISKLKLLIGIHLKLIINEKFSILIINLLL